MINGQEPLMAEDIENVKDGKFCILRKGLFSHWLHPEGHITGVNSSGGNITQGRPGG
jgi:hypothetical protein